MRDNSRRAYEAQVSQSVVPLVIHGSRSEQRAGLIALARLAPRLAIALSAVIQETSRVESDRRFAADIGAEASTRAGADDFFWHLGLARELLTRNVDDHACIEYSRAWNVLPGSFFAYVDVERIALGQLNCSGGQYSRGAHEFQSAFGRIQTW